MRTYRDRPQHRWELGRRFVAWKIGRWDWELDRGPLVTTIITPYLSVWIGRPQ